jgi:adenylate kinase family enzyme
VTAEELHRVSVVGSTGSGKTTFATALAERLGVVCVEIDALYWGPDWSGATDDELAWAVSEAAAGDAWVIDGNYSRVQPLIWERADTVVFLDYSFPRAFWQLLRRTIGRAISKEPMWSGNTETVRQMLSKDSIILWQLKTYRRTRRRYPERFADPRWEHLIVARFRKPRQAAAWLESVTAAGLGQQ